MQNIEHRIGPYRVVDLSTHLVPGQSRRTCEVTRFYQPDTGDYHSTLQVESHAGTHVETPWHYGIERSILDLPPTAYMGRAVKIYPGCIKNGNGGLVTFDDSLGGTVRDGDIAVLMPGDPSEPFAALPHDDRPQLSLGLAATLAAKGVKALALGNRIAIEKDNEESKKIHHLLLHDDILLIENLRNLESLKDNVFLLIAMPLPVAGLDSCPVYALGVEGVPGFCPEKGAPE